MGALLGSLLPQLQWVFFVNVFTFVGVGVLAASAVSLRALPFALFTSLVGLSHGYANGSAGLTGGGRLLYVLGVTLAAYVLVTLAVAGAQLLREKLKWGAVALRAAGSWIVAIGLIYAGVTLVGGQGPS